MTEEELLSVLTDFNDVVLKAAKGEMEIEPQTSIILHKRGGGYETKISGYVIKYGIKAKVIKPKNLLKFLKRHGAVTGEAVNLIGIGPEMESYEKYLAGADFDKIDMAGLLDKYGDIATSFSLTCPYNGGDGEIYNLSEELALTAEKEISDWAKATAKEQIENINGLPPFEKLYAEIEEEYRLLYKEKEDFAKNHDGNIFICDGFAKGNAKYKEPPGLWHVYHNVEFAAVCARKLEQMKNSSKKRDLCEELKDEEVLIQNLENIKVSFNWHCTTSGELAKTFFFTLNEDTEKWLLKHRDDYDFTTLQDLAFYNDNDVLFSSCTHERFHTDLSKKGEDK